MLYNPLDWKFSCFTKNWTYYDRWGRVVLSKSDFTLSYKLFQDIIIARKGNDYALYCTIISNTSQIVGPFGAADLRFYPKITSALPWVSNYSHRSLIFPKKTFQANQFSTLRHVSNKAACKNSFDTFSEWLAYRKIKFIFSAFLSL